LGIGGLDHLAQIMLLTGSFETILRYDEMRKVMSERAFSNSESFKAFLADPENYWRSEKRADLKKTDFENEMLLGMGGLPNEFEIAIDYEDVRGADPNDENKTVKQCADLHDESCKKSSNRDAHVEFKDDSASFHAQIVFDGPAAESKEDPGNSDKVYKCLDCEPDAKKRLEN
jgi:hypothetical protein